MAVKFISNVDENEAGEWYITLNDTLQDRSVVCNDLDEYREAIQEWGGEYGNDIEVVWNKSKTLSLNSYQDLNNKMDEFQEEYQKEINEMANPNV